MALTLADRIEGLFIGVAIGDAKGIPFEMKKKEEIEKMDAVFTARSTVFIDCPKGHHLEPLKGGQWTDDTQLTLATAEGLINAGSFNLTAIAERHIVALKEKTVGWGGGTKAAVERLAAGSATPFNSGNPGSQGNGILMKLTPLVLYWIKVIGPGHRDAKLKQIEQFARMTHDNAKSVISAATFAFTLEYIFTFSLKSTQGECLLDTAQGREEMLHFALEQSQITEAAMVARGEKVPEDDKKFSKRFFELIRAKGNLGDDQIALKLSESAALLLTYWASLTVLQYDSGGNYDSYESLLLVMALLGANSLTFQSLLRAAFIGGDTDSNASMVGAVLGFCKGLSAFPAEFVDQVQDSKLIRGTAKRFSQALETMNKPVLKVQVSEEPELANQVVAYFALALPVGFALLSTWFK